MGAGQAFAGSESLTFSTLHTDYRKTPKLERFAATANKSTGDAEAVARAFLKEHAASYGLGDAAALPLTKVQKSLLATHFHFSQVVGGIPVDKGEVIVSVDHATHAVSGAFNNAYPGQEQLAGKAKRATISTEQAYDAAWADLRVHGKLQSAPSAKLVYRVDPAGTFRLVYVTVLHTQAPVGAWEHEIDAYTGKVISRKDTTLERKASKKPKADPASYSGAVLDRRAAFAAFNQKAAVKSRALAPGRANGTGLVFDPDPRTTLNNPDLQDDSPATAFDAAYFQRDLLDLAYDGTTYKLEGPWVKISDFESPTDAPSTSTTGQWTAKRGTNAFNDAMVYFHLDQSQRYIQSLGFVGDHAIQGGPIEADSDGVDGDDNSHYLPASNQLAYGHGCVDDDEDADVILHEYGHAITYSINANFDGGDSGAIGEGFGDYWGASYSYSMPAGQAYRPYDIYSWDGHGATDACWAGRVLNATEMRYDPTQTYDAHVPMGDRQSDELWSTPIFEALTTLMAQGVARSEVDQIVLEGQFGLGANVTMRELAESTIAAAQRLHPNGPHAGVFTAKFADQQIIAVPHASLALDHLQFDGLGADGVADPGETFALQVALINGGTVPATGIEATLTSDTPGVAVDGGTYAYHDAPAGGVILPDAPLTVSVGQIACGTTVRLTLSLTYENGLQRATTSVPVTFTLGVMHGLSASAAPNAAIPDNDAAGVTSTVSVASEDAVTSALAVDLNVTHPYVGDLKIVLTSPGGVAVVLHANSGASADNIVGRYPTTLTPDEPLTAFVGQPAKGDWTLRVVDSAAGDAGSLVSWGLSDISGYECQP